MNNIQKLIDGLTDQLLQAEMQAKATDNEIDKAFFNGYYSACKKHRKELTLLLNAEAETNGEKDCKNDGNAVGQNEQTKEVKKAVPFGIALLRAKQHYRNTEDDNIPF